MAHESDHLSACDAGRHALEHGNVDLAEMIGLANIAEGDEVHGYPPFFVPAPNIFGAKGLAVSSFLDTRRAPTTMTSPSLRSPATTSVCRPSVSPVLMTTGRT